MNNAQSKQATSDSESLYVEPGTRQCRIFAIRGKLRPGLSPEELLASQTCREVGRLEQGHIIALEKQYWPTADETRLTGGMLLPVKQIPSAGRQDA
jgi:hypothetical protein